MSENQPTTSPGPGDWRHFLGPAGLLALLVVAAYWPALGGGFVWDDELLVQKNPLVTGQCNLASVWFKTDFSLTTVALWLQWLAWGNHAVGFHIVNVALHLGACVLLWRVLDRLKVPGARLAAAIFAVHPVAAASVAWISEMKNTLSLVLCLASCLLFLKSGPETESGPKTKTGYAFSVIAFLLALLAKTSVVMLPVILLLCAWWRRGKIARRDWLRTSPFFLLSLLLGSTTILFQSRVMAEGDPVQTENVPGRLALAGRALWFYLGKILAPLNLSMIYPRWTEDSHSLVSCVPAILWCALLAVLWTARKNPRARGAFFALAVFSVALFPVLGFLSMDYLVISRVSDHFQYLPMIAVIAFTAAGLVKFLPSMIFRSGLLSALAVMTFARSEIISNNLNLWSDVLQKNPESFTAHNNLGCLMAANGKLDQAIEQFKLTLKFNPKNAPAHANLGRAFSLQHRYAEAEENFQAALKIKPADADIQEAYASSLAEQGRISEAISHLRAATKTEPRVEWELKLAGWLHATGSFREAVGQYRTVLEREPDSVEALNNAAWLLATSPDEKIRNGTDAVKFAQRACSLTNEKNPMMLGTLAAAYAEAGRFDDAVAAAQKAVDLAQASGSSPFAEMNRRMLELYRAGKPFREPVR